MSDGTSYPNNPMRVPSLLSAIDGPQDGAPRLIHPIGMMVGTPVRETVMESPTQFIVPADGVYLDDSGSPIQLFKGDRLPFAQAAQFKDFRDDTVVEQAAFVPAAVPVLDERGDTVPPGNGEQLVTSADVDPAADTDAADEPEPEPEERAKGKAPQNRAKGAAPENRSAE